MTNEQLLCKFLIILFITIMLAAWCNLRVRDVIAIILISGMWNTHIS